MSAAPHDDHGGDPGTMTCMVDNAFPQAMIDQLNRLAEDSAGESEVGGIMRADGNEARMASVRRSEVVWLKDSPENIPIYDLIAKFVQQANTQVYRYELSEFAEPFQLATYKSSEEGFYGWHIDVGGGKLAHRKLSLIVPLTDPSEYEGGEFQAFYDSEPVTIPMPLGRVVAFPSFMLHRVTPVTKGIRRSLAIWVAGRPYR